MMARRQIPDHRAIATAAAEMVEDTVVADAVQGDALGAGRVRAVRQVRHSARGSDTRKGKLETKDLFGR